MNRPFVIISLVFLVFSNCLLAQQISQTPHSHEEIAFRPNQGQFEGDFSHAIYTPRYAAYLNADGFTIGMSPIEALKAHHDSAHAYSEVMPAVPVFGFSWTR